MTEPTDHLSRLRARLVNTVDIDERAELEHRIAVLEAQLNLGVEQRVINTGGGDYAQGNIDKRQYYTVNMTPAPSVAEWRRKLSLKLYDHSNALISRVEAFVGRKAELAAIRALISQNIPAGGYVVIRGQAGQGKSSIIAHLIEDYGALETAHHFIPSNPIPQYEVMLLGDLAARLALKHELVDFTLDSDTLPTLSQNFEQVLQGIAERGYQEVIFIDGLDQLSGHGITRNLGFLPTQLRPGIVIVLTTRPDDTLRSLTPHTSKRYYDLPELSQEDWVELLNQHGASVSPNDIVQLHTKLHGHALYLKLAAQLLTEDEAPEVARIVERVDADAEGLFSLSIERLSGHSDWPDTVKPILAILTTARAPISQDAIEHLSGSNFERVRNGLERLGGLIKRDPHGRTTLYHEKLREFLTAYGHDRRTPFDAREIRGWHARLAQWGLAQEAASEPSWPDPERDEHEAERHRYAENHLPAHVLFAQDEQLLQQLLRFDPSKDEEVARLEQRLRLLQLETKVRINDGKYLLLQHLLPLGIGPLSTDSSTKWAASRVRQAFRRWLDQYSETDRMHVREAALDRLRDQLKQAPTPGACWLVSVLGYRREDITAVLWDVAEQHDNEIGDCALAALANTGASTMAVDRYIAVLSDRGARRWNTALRAGYRHHANARLVDVISQYWLSAGSDALSDFDRMAVLDVLVTAAERDSTGGMADAIWDLLDGLAVRHPEIYVPILRMGSGIVGKCDSSHVIPSLLKFLDLDTSGRHRELVYRRLADSIRPRQLAGWEQAIEPHIREIIQTDVYQDSKTQGNWRTVDMDVKLFAWDTALCLNIDDLPHWVEPTLTTESNPDVAGYVMYRIAYLQLSELPQVIQNCLTEPFDKWTHTQEEWSRRIAAIRIAHSSPSDSAFAALLHCGLHIDESALQHTADALADNARMLAQFGNTTVAERLITTYRTSEYQYQRSAAAQAIAALAAEGRVSGVALLDVVGTLDEEERSPLERGYIISALGYARDITLSQDLLDQFAHWGRERTEDWLSLFAIEALARRGDLRSYSDLMVNKLNVLRHGSEWVFQPNQGERDDKVAYFICLLYQRYPQEFADVLTSWITEGEWYEAEPIVEYLADRKRVSDEPIPPVIQRGLITRVIQRQQRNYAEREIIQQLDILAPELLLETDWPTHWNTWWSIARAALADAIGRAAQSQPGRTPRAIELLEPLTDDAEYEVRRAAYRACARCSVESLLKAGQLWAAMPETNARLRAAETLAWFSTVDDSVDALAVRLGDDPEPAIRQAAEAALAERQEHAWATNYLTHIKAFVQANRVDVPAIYRYGAALTKIGDDETIRDLHQIAEQSAVSPNVRYWIHQLINKLQNHWKKAVSSWKGRWLPVLEAVVEEGEGLLMHPSDSNRHVRYRVWRRAAPSASGIPSWGGIITPETDFTLWGSSLSVTLRFEDGREGQVWVPFFMGNDVEFLGESPYPNRAAEVS